jgi:1,4-alpha-glucan branching enzyme
LNNNQQRYEEVHFIDTEKPVWHYSMFSDDDITRFQNGTHCTLYNIMGAHALHVLGMDGFYFAVWAPNATRVSVVGEFNNWNGNVFVLHVRNDNSGIWEGFIPNIKECQQYKYEIHGFEGSMQVKGDPYAYLWQKRPDTASVTCTLQYTWQDSHYMRNRFKTNALDAPWSVYEMHLGSWMKPIANDEESFNTYQQIGERLIPYLQEMHFTHVEFMPVMEYPFDGSWGYQGAGYFAPTSRFGSPQDFMELIDKLHNAGIGVILDWVPSHFPYDAHGLFMFDGTHTYEYADMRKGFHPDWNSYIFNYKRGEVVSFLLSSAHYWFDKYHIDGIRVDAVSSMIYLNYSREEGEWEPNEFGGDANMEALDFVKKLNTSVYQSFPDVQMIAEEATNYQWVAKPIYDGGLGFGMKWMMGWMHDTLKYFKTDSLFRQFHQNIITFSIAYAFNENYMLPLSHDEVVHGKSPMLYKMPGDEWQKFANLRLLYTYMWTHPGTKLLFMGGEFGQTSEWNYKNELDWGLLQYDCHSKLKYLVSQLNKLYKEEKSLYEKQFSHEGFEWLVVDKPNENVLAYMRKGSLASDNIVVIMNTTSVVKHDYIIALPYKKQWKEILNSDHEYFWGSGNVINTDIENLDNKPKEHFNRYKLNLPPLAAIVLK